MPGAADRSAAFDIIGDVHGCFDELEELLRELGYRVEAVGLDDGPGYRVAAPPGRAVVFLGDRVDRGPKIVPVVRRAMEMVEAGQALYQLRNDENRKSGFGAANVVSGVGGLTRKQGAGSC